MEIPPLQQLNHQPELVDENGDCEEDIDYRGLFTVSADDDELNAAAEKKKSKAKKKGSHIASAEIMRKMYAVMKSFDQFIQFTPNLNEKMMSCNDLLLVYIRNVEFTAKQGGTQKMERLPDGRQEATILCRSEKHLVKMMKVLIPAIRARKLGDTRFVYLFTCEFVFTMNGSNVIDDYIKELENERRRQEDN